MYVFCCIPAEWIFSTLSLCAVWSSVGLALHTAQCSSQWANFRLQQRTHHHFLFFFSYWWCTSIFELGARTSTGLTVNVKAGCTACSNTIATVRQARVVPLLALAGVADEKVSIPQVCHVECSLHLRVQTCAVQQPINLRIGITLHLALHCHQTANEHRCRRWLHHKIRHNYTKQTDKQADVNSKNCIVSTISAGLYCKHIEKAHPELT